MLALRLFQIFVVALLAYSIIYGIPRKWNDWKYMFIGYGIVASLIIGVESYA